MRFKGGRPVVVVAARILQTPVAAVTVDLGNSKSGDIVFA